MRRWLHVAGAGVALVAALASSAVAQAVAAPAGRPAGQPPGGGAAAGRPALERLAAAVQRQLGLSDEQAQQLRESTRNFAQQRDQLLVQERATRMELRANVMRGDSADQARIGQLLDRLVAHQRRRIDLVAEEQRELAKFLTPLQRAQFLAMQERALRAAQQLRAERAARTRASGALPVDTPRQRPAPNMKRPLD
jgi:Spy/CpxP family protein refolding chaperone